jgi:hypothetical protein
MMRKRRYIDFRRPTSIPFILLIAYLALDVLTCGVGIHLLFPAAAQADDADKNKAPNAAPVATKDVLQRLEAVEKRLESMPQATTIENRAADLQKLLAALVTVGTIFGLALGVGTYVNLKDIQKNAEKELAEIRADFPAIARLNRKIAIMLEEMRSYGNLRLEELDEESYSGFSADEREEILLREMAFNALTFFDYGKVEALQSSAAEAFVTFGHFYGARYLSDQNSHAAAFQRAVIYLDRALENGKTDIATRVRTALGVLYLWESAKESDPNKQKFLFGRAKQNLTAVLAGNELDPRCLMAAAWIDRRENRMAEAIGRLNKLIQGAAENKLADHQVRRFLGKAHFNRACYLTLSGDLDQALKDLWDSRRVAEKYGDLNEKWVKDLKAEYGADLASLYLKSQQEFTRIQDLSYRQQAT